MLKAPVPGGTAILPKPPAETGAAATGAAPGEARGGVEAGLAHKQKLDCALQLARSVALDFNNALTSILGHTSLLLSKMEAGDPSRGSLVEIEKSAARAAEIANDLAVFSRQEKDLRVQVSGNMNLLLERTVEVFQNAMQLPMVISRQLERKLFTANFDEAKMQQALVKILENAVEAIKGSGKINVQTRNLRLTEATQDRTAKLNPEIMFASRFPTPVAGIPDDVMSRIFEAVFSGDQGSAPPGPGPGLGLWRGHQSRRRRGLVSSQPEIGSSVRLYLPGQQARLCMTRRWPRAICAGRKRYWWWTMKS